MQKVYKNSKTGISLITVLLFMMIATIAATATYKWITSEGRSSASRMLQREAYQSSIAGIENARAWMTYHANDVGALIKAYIDGGNKPVNIDDRLRTLQRAGQDYHVWLVGVNTEKSTYKLKILSSGEARNNTRHSEVAIFNVDGLYQVKVPQEKTKSEIDFEYAYFGGGVTGTSTYFQSAIMNGDWGKGNNPPTIEKNWVVTGNADLSGSGATAGELTCIGGNADLENKGISGKDVYIGGKFTGSAELTGNAYFDGNVTQGQGGNFSIAGNVTLNGELTTEKSKPADIHGNFCLEGNGWVNYQGDKDKHFKVDGHVWMPGSKPLWNTNDDISRYDEIVFGKDKNSKVYIEAGHPWSDYDAMRDKKWFLEDGDHPRKCAGTDIDGKSAYCEEKNSQVQWWTSCLGFNCNKYKPYEKHDEGRTKENLFYIYYMPEGVVDVTFGTFLDKYWKWQWQNGSVHREGTVINAYFVNASNCKANDKGVNGGHDCDAKHIFTDSYHSKTVTEHGGINGYRYLNHNGTAPTASPFCKKGDDEWRPECDVKPWFRVDGEFQSTFPAEKPEDLECAESVKEKCDLIWKNEPGCDGSAYKIKDPIVTAKDEFEKFANKVACAKDITQWNDNLVSNLNACYAQASVDESQKDNFYNGFLVVKLSSSSNSNGVGGNLSGKFIIIVEPQINAQNAMISATDGSSVFLYLIGGASYLQGTSKHVFIYSEGPITLTSKIQLTGTLYTPADKCHKVRFENASLDNDLELLKELTDAAIICNNDGSPCGGSSGGAESGSGSSESLLTETGYDKYFISMAPQLGITLESQYENNESLPIANYETELNPSFIVLPRVIYLPSDPYGELPDYYNVLPLNGSALQKEDVSVSCSGIPSSGKLYNDGTPLNKGKFKCEASAANHDNVPFWVVIGEDQRSTPAINFVEPSHEMPASGSHEVKVNVPAHDQPIKLNVSCPSAPEKWDYSLAASGTKDGNGKCIFDLPANNASSQVTLFTVTTTSAASGTLVFNLLSGEGYNLTSPYSAELHVSSNATLNRIEATLEDIKTYCTNSPENCPAENLLNEWPDCDIEETWVEPSTNFGVNTRNNSWAISVGGTGEVKLNPINNDKCIIIIPQEGNSLELSTLEVNKTYELKASIKRKKRSVKVGFKGEIDGKNPVLNINAGGRTSQCAYGDLSDDKTCTISVFDGETISLSIDKENNTENEQFSYWKCASGSCPTTEPITSSKYNDFSVSDNETVIYAYFNEQDKHCFFEEFKENSLECSNGETEYCIDDCGGTCSGTSGGEYSKAKWHLVDGSINEVSKDYDYIRIKESIGKKGKDGAAIKVLSTVNAGIYGTMKALFQLPKATSNYGTASANISQSGFMLRSNNSATEYLMLNLYVNKDGKLEAKLCTENNGNCASQFLRNSSNNEASVSTSNMIMMSATLSAENLIVSAFTGNYYGDPTEYTTTFDMKGFSNYGDRAHEFVGFSLADENFKLYGIGWKSEDYASECHDTYPTVKCSFAAVAENGIIPTEKTVKPWVGHSGWFDSENCTEKYYYYNGTDACSGSENGSTECPFEGYSFSESGAGVHGYLEGNQEVKTAKAWLVCTPSSEKEYAWATETEIERAHCGLFWTGKISECVDDTELFSGELSISNEEKSTTFSSNSKANLRGTTLNIELENTDNAEVEIWLLSKNEKWGSDDFESTPVKMSNNSASFEVEKTFSDGAEGFDPENVTAIVLKTTGNVVLKSITTKCKNTIGISNCNAEYNKELSKWIITADITNKDKVNSYNVVGSVDGSSEFSISAEPSWIDNQATFEDSHNPYNSNQDKTYSITASITQGTITKETFCGEITIGKITCSDAKIDGNATVESGSEYPKFSFKLNECPNEGCPYEIYLNDTKQSSDEGTGSLNYTVQGTAPECEIDNGCEYTYTVKSASSDYPFDPCSATFKVVKKVEPIGLSCTNFAKLTGKETSSDISITPTVSNCDGGCTYDIKQNGTSVSSGDYPGPISFNGESEAGTKNYTLSMTRKNDNVTDTCNFSVEYKEPFEVTCDIADQTDKEQGSEITVTPYSVQGCNADCYYDIKLDGSSVIGGEKGSYDGSSVSFTGANSAGEKNYTLTIYSPDKSKQKDCTFKVTYKESAGGTATCVWENGATSFWPGQNNVKLLVSNIQGLTSDAEFTLTCGTSSVKSICRPNNGSCDNLQFAVPSAVGPYTCTLKNSSMTLCTPSLEVKAPLSCSVSSNTVDYGSTFSFTGKTATSSCHNCKLYRGNNEHEYLNNKDNIENYEITFNWSESKTFTYECQCDNMSSSANKCSQTVASQINPPTFDCKTGLKATIDKSDNVTIGLENVNGCHEGGNWCKYTITGTDINKTGTGISNGSVKLGAFTDNDTDGNSKYYDITLENSAGVGEPKTCSVEFTEGSSGRVIPSNIKTFTVSNGETFCFENHDKPESWSNVAQVNCGQCQGNSCSGTIQCNGGCMKDGYSVSTSQTSVAKYNEFSQHMNVVNNVFSGCVTINWSNDDNAPNTTRTCNIYGY